ncbi:hypothetical protein GCM10010361_50850 [Streptomyces olivaceiscleroticus]|uniref:Uncharacterized protein n=1 Tax=Streptomyces olivaceiscleroticus TaxID=68245 RepID=A0ABN1AM40_9ACTN
MFSGSTPMTPRCPMVRKDKAASLLWLSAVAGGNRQPAGVRLPETAASLTGHADT